MRIFEVLTEISAGEKARRAKLSAQSKRAQAAVKNDPPRKKGVPDNVPPKSHYITNKPLMKQADIPGAFAGAAFDAFREPEVDPTEHRGVVLRFHIEQTPKPMVYGFWAHDYAPDFNDCKLLGTVRALGIIYSKGTLDLVDELIYKEHNVSIFIDPPINKQFSSDVNKLKRWATSNSTTNKYKGSLNFEIDDAPEKSSSVSQPVTVPSAELKIPNSEALTVKIMQYIRNNSALSEKYKSVTSAIRAKALHVGVATLYKTNDIESALDDVDVTLDS